MDLHLPCVKCGKLPALFPAFYKYPLLHSRTLLERLKDGNIHVFLFPFRLYAFYKPTPVHSKSTFRYNSMFNFIPVSFCFFVNFRVRVRVRVSYKVRVRVRVRDR